MKQFRTILKFELKHYFKNKVFVGTTIFLMVVISAVMCYPRLSVMFDDKDAGNAPQSRAVILVKSEDIVQRSMIKQAFENAFPANDIQITDAETEVIRDKVTSGNAECAFVITGPTAYTYYVANRTMYDSKTDIADEALRNLYRMNAMVGSGMTTEEAGKIINVPITSQVKDLGKDQSQHYFYTYIMIFALYMVIILYGQLVSTNVAAEKSSRAMEVLITSAKPVSMMFGKVLASCLAGLIQLIAVFGTALAFYQFNKHYWEDNMIINSFFNIPIELLIYMLVFFVLGFLIYAFLYGAIGSTATKLEDINTSTLPITVLFVIAFIVVITSMSSGNVDNLAMVICSYVPFTSPMAMFTRIAMSTVPVYEVLISIVILIASTIGIGVLSAKIYRVGVLLYGTTPKIGTILKSVWKA